MITCPAEFLTADGQTMRGELVNDGGTIYFRRSVGPAIPLDVLRTGKLVLLVVGGEPSRITQAMRDLCDMKGIAASIGRLSGA